MRSPDANRCSRNPGMKFLTRRHTGVTMLSCRNSLARARPGSWGVRIRAIRWITHERCGSRGAIQAMHIPDSVLDTKVIAATAVVGALGLAIAVRKIERRLGDGTTVLMGTMAAFVFAAQMVNFPVGPLVSGHLLGGVLASVLLGPWAGAVVIAAVLLVQCFMFADGGVTALGANFVNMGLIGAVGGYAIYTPIRRAIGGQKGVLIAAMSAAWFSVLLASGACAVELAASGHGRDLPRLLAWMALVHAVIGLGEALITGAAVRFLLVRRPDLFELTDDAPGQPHRAKSWGEVLLGGLGVAMAVAVFLAPFAYDKPDGLEFVGKKLEVLAEDEGPPKIPAPIPEYKLLIAGADHVKTATAAAGVVGTLLVFGVALGMARILPRPKPIEAHADAA
jgi:cobalt/nickel transport system permease protein